MKRLGLFLPLGFFLILVVGGLLLLGRSGAPKPDAMLVGEPVPAFALDAFRGPDIKGQVSVINIFASWCLPCEAEHPMIVRLKQAGVKIYGINYKDSPEGLRKFLARRGDPYDSIGNDTDGQAALSLGVTGVPSTFIVDRDGIIRYRLDMPVTEPELNNVILPLIQDLSR